MSLLEIQNIEILKSGNDVEGLITILRKCDNVRVRTAAPRALGLIGNPVAVPALLDCVYLRSFDDNRTRNMAIEALVLIGPGAVEPLIEALKHADREVREAAAEALGKIGDARAVEPLLKTFHETRSYNSARALGRIGNLRAVVPLIEILNDYDGNDQKNDAAKALAELGDERALAQLNMLVQEDHIFNSTIEEAVRKILDPKTGIERNQRIVIREIAAQALEDQDKPGKYLQRYKKYQSRKQLIKAMWENTDHRVYNTAIRALVRIGEPVIEPVMNTLETKYKHGVFNAVAFMSPEDAGHLLRSGTLPAGLAIENDAFQAYGDWKRAMELLGCIGSPAVEPLMKMLMGDDESIRYMAIEPLGIIGEFEGNVKPVPLLLDALKSNNNHIRGYAADALGRIGDVRAVEPLIEALKDDDKLHVLPSAVVALGKIGDPRAVKPLISLLWDEEINIDASISLRSIGSPAAQHLIEALDSDDIEVRRRAIWCLGDIKDKSVVEPLLAALNDKEVSKEAARALERMQNPEATDHLLNALVTEQKKSVREVIAFALDGGDWTPDASKEGAAYWIAKHLCERCIEIGEPAVEMLIPVLKYRDMRMRVSSAAALGKIGDYRAIDPLIKAMDGKNEFVQKAAAEALDMLGWIPEIHRHIEIMEYYVKREKEYPPDIDEGQYLIQRAIDQDLIGNDPREVHSLFQQAAEKCRLSRDYIHDMILWENYDDLAVGHLWSGYALLSLGKYVEGHELLTQVVPYFNKYKQIGNEMWRKVEYALPKSLVPLCEYKLNPVPANLHQAREGIERYINSLKSESDRQKGLRYYGHLKKKFPDVFFAGNALSTRKTGIKLKVSKPVEKLEIVSDRCETKGSVIVFDRDGSGSLEVFGTHTELEDYVEKVGMLGNYPILSALIELYATEGLQEPEPLIKECEMLLLRPDIGSELEKKTKLILAVAKDAMEADSTVMLYFDPEVE